MSALHDAHRDRWSVALGPFRKPTPARHARLRSPRTTPAEYTPRLGPMQNQNRPIRHGSWHPKQLGPQCHGGQATHVGRAMPAVWVRNKAGSAGGARPTALTSPPAPGFAGGMARGPVGGAAPRQSRGLGGRNPVGHRWRGRAPALLACGHCAGRACPVCTTPLVTFVRHRGRTLRQPPPRGADATVYR
jgi:hypothetical protein